MPSTQLRQSVLTAAKSVVVKIGTQLLTCDDAGKLSLDTAFIRQIAKQIAQLHKKGCRVTLVSSGAVGAGCAVLGIEKRPTDLAELQAVAAVGQRQLMTEWHKAFVRYRMPVGQVVLTRTDFDDRVRFLNIRNCINKLHELGGLPILNENDTVAIEELRFGDNDLLAALTTNALRADALLLLTTVDGLLDADGNVIDLIEDMNAYLGLLRSESSKWGRGGMATKLEAAKLVMGAGEVAVIASGREPDILRRLLDGEKLGTVCMPAGRKLDSRQRWIALTARPSGTIQIDAGAASAICERGKSLLATGITQITGRFERGDVLLVRSDTGKELARGLTNYSAEELRLIMGKRSNQFEKILGKSAYDEVIHRDNLVILNRS
ncbi:MAG: glutamate 5-kinase [Phycisphaeraceae bacterium]